MKLYDLTDEMLELYESDADEKALQKVAGEIKVKAESIAKFIKNLDSDAKGLKDEIDRLSAKKKAIENKAKELKNYVKENMEKLELKSINAGVFRFSIVDVSKETVEVDNPEELPDEYQKKVISADKTKILESYRESGVVPKGAKIKTGYSYLKLS